VNSRQNITIGPSPAAAIRPRELSVDFTGPSSGCAASSSAFRASERAASSSWRSRAVLVLPLDAPFSPASAGVAADAVDSVTSFVP